jgi:hypothetical protein
MKSGIRSAQSTQAELTVLQHVRVYAGATSSISVTIRAKRRYEQQAHQHENVSCPSAPGEFGLIVERLNYILCIVLIRSVTPATDLYMHLAIVLVASPFLEW